MKVWPIDPLVAGYFSLEVSEKLPQGLTVKQNNVLQHLSQLQSQVL